MGYGSLVMLVMQTSCSFAVVDGVGVSHSLSRLVCLHSLLSVVFCCKIKSTAICTWIVNHSKRFIKESRDEASVILKMYNSYLLITAIAVYSEPRSSG